MKIIVRGSWDKIWRYRLILLFLVCTFFAKDKVYGVNIYIDPVMEVCTPRESNSTIIYHIDRSLKSIYFNYYLNQEIRDALDNARERGIKIKAAKTHNTIIIDDHIVIMFGRTKMFIFDSISLAEECVND